MCVMDEQTLRDIYRDTKVGSIVRIILPDDPYARRSGRSTVMVKITKKYPHFCEAISRTGEKFELTYSEIAYKRATA